MDGEPADGMGSVPAVCVDGVPKSGMGNEPAACEGDEFGPEPEPPAAASDPEGGVPRCVPSLGADSGPVSGTVSSVPAVCVGDTPAVGVNDAPGVSVGDMPAVRPGSEGVVGGAPGVPAA